MAHLAYRASRPGALSYISSQKLASLAVPVFLAPSFAVQLPHSNVGIPQSTRHGYSRIRLSSSVSHKPASKAASIEGQANTLLNPPASTRPPPLETPTRAPDQSRPSYLFALGKAYLNFYKSGLWAVWTNVRLASAIEDGKVGRRGGADAALADGRVSRAEWQLVRRSGRDVRKLPLFGLVLLVFGEFTPLVVMAVSSVVPSTCRIPRQVAGERQRTEDRRRTTFRQGDSVLSLQELEKGLEVVAKRDGGSELALGELRKEQLLHIGRSLGLYSTLWDTLWDRPPHWILVGKVKRWMRYIDLDDAAIEKSGGVRQLEADELKIAAEDRGIDVLGRDDAQLRDTLQRWMGARKKQSVAYLVLTRPNVWDRWT